ncbi:MAG: SURF1 family protein [Hyphomicrobium sp.]|jgi:surfeit locus 1 family protein|nr:SURF1 family protein [Hyphomicrobium sp.]
MLSRLKAAGLIWPTIISILALPVLIALGTWQWQRMEWKADLIAKIEARAKGEPESYAQALDQFARDGEAEYQKVRVKGTFDYSTERYLYAPNEQSQGWNVFTLLTPEDGGPPVFVNRGWVPDRLKDPATRVEGQIAGPVEVIGLVRGPEKPGMFDVASDPQRKQWYWRDLEGMRWAPDQPPAPKQREAMRIAAYAPFSLDALAEPTNPGGWPKGGTTQIHLSNRHLEYVLTWWGLAATLVLVYLAFARQRLRGNQKEILG